MIYLWSLLDSYNVELVKKVNKEIEARNLYSLKRCKVGLEVHFNDGGKCAHKQSSTDPTKRFPRALWCIFCSGNCSRIEASN